MIDVIALTGAPQNGRAMNDLPSPHPPRRPAHSAMQRGRSALLAGLAAAGGIVACALPGAGMDGRGAATVMQGARVTGQQADGLAPVLAMLAQYDRRHDDRALLEALRWFNRAWEAGDPRVLAVAQPLHLRACQHARLQWSWLCEAGE